MMIRGVTTGRPPLDDVLVVDIGGGSTELVLADDGEVAVATSLDVGCVRITERFLGSDPPSAPELAAAGAYVRSLLPALEASSAIGVAGTVTTLATLDLGDDEYDPARTHGHRIPLSSVEGQLERLAAMTLEERLVVPGLEPGRAPVIVAGIVVLREVMSTYGLDEIEVSERRRPSRSHARRRRAARAGGRRRAPRRVHLLLGGGQSHERPGTQSGEDRVGLSRSLEVSTTTEVEEGIAPLDDGAPLLPAVGRLTEEGRGLFRVSTHGSQHGPCGQNCARTGRTTGGRRRPIEKSFAQLERVGGGTDPDERGQVWQAPPRGARHALELLGEPEGFVEPP